MKKALAGVLAVTLAGLMAGSAIAQIPNVQVYFDPALNETQAFCPPAGPPVLSTLHVVFINWNMNVAGVDFSIQYPPALIWLADQLVDPLTQISLGTSPTGIAVVWANCCAQDGFQPFEALRPFVQWGVCDPTCNQPPQAVVVGGYAPLGKENPSAIRKEDLAEFSGLGMTSLICPGPVATVPSTWGQVKALYR